MSEDGEKQGGIGAAGVIGMGAGGAAAGYFGHQHIANNGLKEAMAGSDKAPKEFTKNLEAVFKAKPELATQNEALQAAKKAAAAPGADKALKATAAETEKKLAGEIRTAAKGVNAKFNFNGMNGGLTGGKAKVIGLAVAGVAAGGIVAHKLFGGHHSNRESERRVQQDLGAYR